MAWALYSHAKTGDRRNPRALAVCDRCNFTYNREALKWQYDWAGTHEMNKGILVCRDCMDLPQTQLKTLRIPIDPLPILNPRPGEFAGMVISSSPDAFDTVAPSEIVVQSPNTDYTTHIGDRSPLVTENASLPLLTEVTVTPRPDGEGDASYTRGPST